MDMNMELYVLSKLSLDVEIQMQIFLKDISYLQSTAVYIASAQSISW